LVAGLLACGSSPEQTPAPSQQTSSFPESVATSAVSANGDVHTTLLDLNEKTVLATLDWSAATRTAHWTLHDLMEGDAPAVEGSAAKNPSLDELNQVVHGLWAVQSGRELTPYSGWQCWSYGCCTSLCGYFDNNGNCTKAKLVTQAGCACA
jgi:hypothetical protein